MSSILALGIPKQINRMLLFTLATYGSHLVCCKKDWGIWFPKQAAEVPTWFLSQLTCGIFCDNTWFWFFTAGAVYIKSLVEWKG